SPEATSDRASWREARAAEAKGPEAARLAVEAALEYERAGDIESAARAAKMAEAAGDDALAPIAAYRFALAGFGTAELVDALLPHARNTEDAALRLEIYERLAELDERGRGDTASGLLFRRTILEENPSHLRTLRRVASVLMAGSRDDELEPIVMELARNLEGGEAAAYAALAARLRQRVRWEDTAEPVAIAYSQEPRPLWAIRQMAAHARQRGDLGIAAQCDRELMELTGRPSERATLALRAAQAVRAGGDMEGARQLLDEAVTLVPEHVVARVELAAVLRDEGEFAKAAMELETAAEGVGSPAWKQDLDLQAALLWQDNVGDVDKARAALERVAAVDPNNVAVFERLRNIYVQKGDRAELADLLSRRLEAIEDPSERVEMEVMRGRALAEVGDGEAAKKALAAALDANPDHVDALSSFAELCFSDGDHEGAEQALIRLARLTSEPDKQIEIYFRLGQLYDELLPNEERAELAYQEILKRRPTDPGAREKLIALYRRTGQMPRAIEEQNVLVNAAESPEDKCQRTIELAEILEEVGELKKAESTLVVARKSFPKSDAALRSLVRFYQRTGQAPAGAILLDRAVADARRALGTGRFETFLFETLATAAELRGRHDAANAARAAVLAIDGHEVDISGVGLRAGDVSLDELLAPEVMTPAFRDLLIRTGNMLDSAIPYDLEGIRATPPPPPLAHIGEEVRAVAGAYGLPQISVLVSNVLGPICIPARSHPPTVVMGHTLASQPPSAERTFLLHRAMKVLQANAAVFARTAPIDLWPLLAAYLRVFQPQFSPQGVDSGRYNEAYGRLSRALPAGLGPDIGVLATDVIGSIGNRASTLNSAINGWGSRAGLLAVGDPNVALNSIAWAGGNANGPPEAGKDRLTWIGRNAEARDLIIFTVSAGYVDARARLGAG
ncbi:MAG: tetratricopeptide repeat protein, partial [Myxococcales bacterium]|nr:tetratricopeptide repeat protein [Myxococcales bacterium]